LNYVTNNNVKTPDVVQKTWSLTLQEERRLRVFENMLLRRIFGPRRDEVTGGGK